MRRFRDGRGGGRVGLGGVRRRRSNLLLTTIF